ncbi:Radical SAM domain protein [Verrucomicrobia bacterium]|nr:Radical SAM domain protein [Verrucomicrobiota bacterium]
MLALERSSSYFLAVTEPNLLHPGVLHAQGEEQAALHERAAQAARSRFGRRVFIRGVVEVSNFCRQNCSYCGMRRSNRGLARFRAHHEQLAELLIHHRPASVTDVNIQAGEDPIAVREVVLPLIRTLRRETNLGLSVCLGNLGPDLYDELHAAGATFCILKFEIANPARYAQFEAPGTFEERIQTIRRLAQAGWHVSSGFIAGLPGQSDDDLAANLNLAQQLPVVGCSASPFIPGDETPLSGAPMSDINLTLNCMAALRLMRADWVIPAVSALNLAQPGSGYGRGLRTGANLVTINLTPPDLRGDYVLYRRDRFIMTEERILQSIASEGLSPSAQGLAEFCRLGKVNGFHRTNSASPL